MTEEPAVKRPRKTKRNLMSDPEFLAVHSAQFRLYHATQDVYADLIEQMHQLEARIHACGEPSILRGIIVEFEDVQRKMAELDKIKSWCE